MTHEERKVKGIEILKQMDIYKPYINGFEKKDQVCFFEMFGGFWVDQEPELYEKMKEVEKEHNCTVYAITHDFTEFGELYSYMGYREIEIVSKGVFIISFNFYVVSVLFALVEGIVYVKSILFELIKNKAGSGIHYCLITVCKVERGKVVGTTPGKVNYESKCAYEQKQRNDSDNNCFCVTTHFLLPSLIRK